MSTFTLKLLAVLAMLIDHIGAIILYNTKYAKLYIIFRAIGRLAFPIFAFLIVEGFARTRDVKRYLKRLGIFALISEIPYDISLYRHFWKSDLFTDTQSIYANGYNDHNLGELISHLFSKQNVLFTLFLGLLLIYLMSLVEKRYEKNLLASNLLDAVLTVGFCGIAYFIRTDYSFGGILMIVAFYLFRSSKVMMSMILFLINGTVIANIKSGNLMDLLQLLATFAMLPIALYNGKKGKDIKYFFYIFYPAHLLLLFVISLFIL